MSDIPPSINPVMGIRRALDPNSQKYTFGPYLNQERGHLPKYSTPSGYVNTGNQFYHERYNAMMKKMLKNNKKREKQMEKVEKQMLSKIKQKINSGVTLERKKLKEVQKIIEDHRSKYNNLAKLNEETYKKEISAQTKRIQKHQKQKQENLKDEIRWQQSNAFQKEVEDSYIH